MNNLFIEWDDSTQQWNVITVKPYQIVDRFDTVREAAAAIALIEAIEGCCRVVQNGATCADDIGGL